MPQRIEKFTHGETEQGATIDDAVLAATQGRDDERVRFFVSGRGVERRCPGALETMMKGYEYQSDFAKKYVALGRDQAWYSMSRADGMPPHKAMQPTVPPASLCGAVVLRGATLEAVIERMFTA